MLARHLLSVPEPYAGARRAVVRNLLRLLLITPKALAGRRKAVGQTFFPFYRWDYELVRDGAFVAHPTLPEEPEKIPLITIITRTYQGRSLYLRQALLSVAHQTYPNIEHIVVEDGGNSLQTTVEEIGCLTGRPALYISNEKLGRSSAGNVGLAQAKGRWCLFLDDDDLLFADHLELLAGTLLEDSDAVAAYSLAWEVQTDSSDIADGKYSEEEYKVPPVLKEEYNYTVLEHHNLMAIQSVLFERRLFEERGGFDADLDALEDWVLWLCYGYGNRFVYVPKVTSMYRTPSGQTVRKERQEVLDVAYTTAKERVHSRMKSLGLLLEE
ncbi:MAG: glycosyltransferase [Candidatus Electrothrix sp. AX5]|nr:glycosyltransferase [Candidatus Electrothrix sp. AX5]